MSYWPINFLYKIRSVMPRGKNFPDSFSRKEPEATVTFY